MTLTDVLLNSICNTHAPLTAGMKTFDMHQIHPVPVPDCAPLPASYAVAAFVRHEGQKYTNGAAIRAAPDGIIFWLHTFKLGVYPGAVLPFLIGYLADAAAAIGDLTATEEASFLETHGRAHDERVQGCLLADGELTRLPPLLSQTAKFCKGDVKVSSACRCTKS